MNLILRRRGTWADLRCADDTPIPRELVALVGPHMTYSHRDQTRDPINGSFRITEVPLQLFTVQDGRLTTGYGYLPRLAGVLRQAGVPFTFEDITPASKRGPDVYRPRWENLYQATSFRPRQDECLEAVAAALGGLIVAPPAFGKSYLMRMIACLYPKAKIHIVTRRKDIVQSTMRAISELIPDVGQVGGGMQQFDRRVTVYTAGSLHLSDGDADFLLVDEAPELMTKRASAQLAATYSLSRNFAFQALVDGRSDRADARLESLFGPPLFVMAWPEAVRLGLVVPIEVHWIPVTMETNPCAGMADVKKKRWGLWRNEARNRQIAEVVKRHKADDQMLIMVETLEHAVYLGQHLPDFTLCYDGGSMTPERLARYQRSGMLPADYQPVTADLRQRYRREFEAGKLRRVIATDIWSTGVSFDGLAAVVRADARSSATMDEQIPGRVSRLHTLSGKRVGVLYDTWDYWDPSFKRKSEERYRRYAQKGWHQLHPNARVQTRHRPD